jgi:hypothetical protein
MIMSMRTGPLPSSNNGINTSYDVGKKTEVKDSDLKKEAIVPGKNPAIDQEDKLQSNPVKSYDLKDPKKFPDKPSMGVEGKPPQGAHIHDGQKPKPQVAVEGNKPPQGAHIHDGQKPKPQVAVEGKPPQGAHIHDGQKPKPQVAVEGNKPPQGAHIHDGQKPKPELGNKPNFPTGKPGAPPSGTKPAAGQKPNFPMGDKGNIGIEGTPPPASDTLYPGKKIID